MTSFFLYSAILLMIIIAIPLIRVIKGPSVFDRLLGANAVATKTIVLITIIGYLYGRVDMFVDITLAYAALGFISSLALAKYVTVKRVEEEGS
jgi:multicomponent Na+:H+ antiporter subunit F